MENEKMCELFKMISEKGFTVIEFKQEQHDGKVGIVECNGRGTTGTILIRMVPNTKD